MNVFQVAEGNVEHLMKIPGYASEEEATSLKARAKSVVEKGGEALMLGKDGTPLENLVQVRPGVAPAAIPTARTEVKDAKALAEERLRQEMAAAGMSKSKDKEE
jgi:hypothetical protein